MKHIIEAAKLRLEAAVKADDIEKEMEKAADYFNREVKKILPSDKFYKRHADVSQFLGTPTTTIFLLRTKADVTWHNDYVATQILMQSGDNFGRKIDMDSFALELNSMGKVRKDGLKFRKIKGKDPMECMKKLLVWIKKNKDILIGE